MGVTSFTALSLEERFSHQLRVREKKAAVRPLMQHCKDCNIDGVPFCRNVFRRSLLA